ncbi:uracil-DNA glycosylase family protein [Promicromonospora sukumoe]|uniref:Uracil-DNA glycosylase n=1 Tax=Promicromonospora sukumoe TaxID=88382 RepID=A0A7W3JAD5_9MICO|nr:uracil-DNA glycosylase family protein [Promicromonospora sukumoe]MBA8809206.1 uracil-DNA glycosylase [Promicromonospora sukumoe]
MSSTLDLIRAEIVADPANAWACEAGYEPLYAAASGARIVLVGQAPGRKAQESGKPWNDASGVRLRSWLGVTDEQFYDPDLFAILPMDFYYPGKGVSGDLPPRPGVAERWHPRILAELPHRRLTVLVGGYAQKYYLGGRARKTLTETVRAYQDYLPDMVPLVHPSPLNFRWQAKNPWFEEDVVPALRTAVAAALGPA